MFDAGFMFDTGALTAGLFAFAGTLAAGVDTGATVTGAVVLAAAFAGLAFTLMLVPESPQAMPSALSPRTVESTITFFILFKDSYLSQSINFLLPGVRLIKHSRFALNSFLFKANVNIVIAGAIVNYKSEKNDVFLIFFFGYFSALFSLCREADAC